jgi:REP element-mobilizing transposase RayT
VPPTSFGHQRRNSLRRPHYNYSQPGAYFVTFCSNNGQPIFGQIENQTMCLNPLGEIADRGWYEIAKRHPEIEIDTFVVMPNHIHVLLWLHCVPQAAERIEPEEVRRFGRPITGSISTLIGAYKGSVTQKARRARLILDGPLWQRNFHDHIVRNESELERIRGYINNNPTRWLEDQLHPDAPPNEFNRGWHTSR